MCLFGIDPDKAWFLEWSEFGALVEVHLDAERAKDRRAGVVAAVMRNAWRGPTDEVVGPEDFFGSLQEEEPEMTSEETGELFRSLVLAMGGRAVTVEA